MAKKLILLHFFMFLSLCASAIERTDTLFSTKNDRVIINYEIIRNDNKITVRFLDAKKKLGKTYGDKYKKLNEVEVMFFDRIGNYEDLKFTGLSVNAFMVPANGRYTGSADGYFMMKDSPSLSFEITAEDDFFMSIPMYLAHYEKKKRYEVFTRCGSLLIEMESNVNKDVAATTHSEEMVITRLEVEETGISEIDEANIRMNRIVDLIQDQRKLPISDELTHEISMLRELRYKITDRNVLSRIDETLIAFNSKKSNLEEKAERMALMERERAERESQLAMAREQARQDSIAAVAEQKQRKERQQNMIMLIGGVCLAALAFVGNQYFQHRRNKKNQQDLLDMQQSMVKRAENDAKYRAKSTANNKAYQMSRDSKQKVSEKAIGKKNKNGNKNFSI